MGRTYGDLEIGRAYQVNLHLRVDSGQSHAYRLAEMLNCPPFKLLSCQFDTYDTLGQQYEIVVSLDLVPYRGESDLARAKNMINQAVVAVGCRAGVVGLQSREVALPPSPTKKKPVGWDDDNSNDPFAPPVPLRS